MDSLAATPPETALPPGAQRIVCITHFFPIRKGGIEAVALEINRRLAADGLSIDWFASVGAGTLEPIAGLHFRPVKAINLIEHMAGIPLPLWLSKDISALYTAIRDCDAVHIHDFIYPGSLLALIFARRWKKPVILTQHIGHIPYRKRALGALLSTINHTVGRWALRQASRVVFISNSVEAYFHSFVPFRTPPIYLPNGVDLEIYTPVELTTRQAIRQSLGLGCEDPICLFVGRFVEKKGLQLLAELVRQSPHVKWLFAGEGPLHPDRWQAPNVRVLEGWRRERLADLYRAADLLVLPSRGEGFPLVVQEAFACGTPVLISDEAAAGCERARHLLFEVPITGEGLVKRWTSHLNALLALPGKLEDRRAAVASFAQCEWSWERSVAIYKRLYRDSTSSVIEYPASKSPP
ncbi:MAG: glycosyltransferase family 4 protein [Curvibacter sp.]|nr:glycosyltransferase family 4 protein [Curvibacter sp.]